MTTNFNVPKIQLGDYIVIQRQKYTKLQKFSNVNTTVMLGKEQIELSALLDQPYGSTFKMCTKEAIGSRGRRQRLHTLQLVSGKELRNLRDILGISAAGADNRHVLDVGDASQGLKPEDIEQLREDCENESTKIIEKLVENSKTFHEKTEYSQEKYLKKKEKKYFEFLQIHRPTIRLVQEVYFRQDPDKIMGLRVDTLSQLLSYSDVSAFGNFLLYESGTNGLLPACLIDCMGANTEATLVHMHPGNEPQKQAILAMNFPQEQLQRCVSVNLYSVLREFYQGVDGEHVEAGKPLETCVDENTIETVAEHSEDPSVMSDVNAVIEAEDEEPCSKKRKINELEYTESTLKEATNIVDIPMRAEENSQVTVSTEITKKFNEPLQWQLDNKRACALMHAKFDTMIIVAKEYPSTIVNELLPLLKSGRPFVIFSLYKEILSELYLELKATKKIVNLHVISNWMRWYQILPNRTHPEVNMHTNSGYLLTGYTIES